MLRYYQGLQKCLGLYAENAQYSPDEIESLDALYKSLGQKYSWSSAVKVTRSLSLYMYIFISLFFRNINFIPFEHSHRLRFVSVFCIHIPSFY